MRPKIINGGVLHPHDSRYCSRMNFSGDVFCCDQLVAADVLGFLRQQDGRVLGSMVLLPGQALSFGKHTLVTTGGRVLAIHVLSVSGASHEAMVVEFKGERTSGSVVRESPIAVHDTAERTKER